MLSLGDERRDAFRLYRDASRRLRIAEAEKLTATDDMCKALVQLRNQGYDIPYLIQFTGTSKTFVRRHLERGRALLNITNVYGE